MADIKGRWVAHSVAFIVMILLICFSFHYDYRLSSILAVAGGASVFRVSTSLLISTRMFIKKIERRNEQGLFLNGSGIANWGIRFYQHLRLRIGLPLVLRIRCMGIWRLDICQLHCQYHDGRHLLSPCRPNHPILPPHAHQTTLLLRFPDHLHVSRYRQIGKTTIRPGEGHSLWIVNTTLATTTR